MLAEHAGRLKGGLAKVAQLAAYDPGATLGRSPRRDAGGARRARRAVGSRPGGVGRRDRAGRSSRISAGRRRRCSRTGIPSPLAVGVARPGPRRRSLHDGTDVVVKVQYPGVAEALRADLDDAAFVRKLAGSEVGAHARRRGAARARRTPCAASSTTAPRPRRRPGSPPPGRITGVLRVPRVVAELSSSRVLTMTRARGKTLVETAAAGSPDVRRQAALAIYEFAWGSPLVHGLLNADPNPGNFLVESSPTAASTCGASISAARSTIPDDVRDADRELWWGLLDDDDAARPPSGSAWGSRRGPAAPHRLARVDGASRLGARARGAGRDAWRLPLERRVRARLRRGDAAACSPLGGMAAARASVLLLWRQRLGVAAVIGMLDATAPFRRVLLDLIGTGRRALR